MVEAFTLHNINMSKLVAASSILLALATIAHGNDHQPHLLLGSKSWKPKTAKKKAKLFKAEPDAVSTIYTPSKAPSRKPSFVTPEPSFVHRGGGDDTPSINITDPTHHNESPSFGSRTTSDSPSHGDSGSYDDGHQPNSTGGGSISITPTPLSIEKNGQPSSDGGDVDETDAQDVPFVHSRNPKDVEMNGLELTDTGSRCTLSVDSSDAVEMELPFYYLVETTATFSTDIVEDIERSLISQLCGIDDEMTDNRMLLSDDVVAWESTPKDFVSTDYVCDPANPEAKLCHVVEGGMTVMAHDEDVVTDAYEEIESVFSSLSIVDNDPRVVDVQYVGYDPSSLALREDVAAGAKIDDQSDGWNSGDTAMIALSGALLVLVTLIAGFYHMNRRNKKGIVSSTSNTFEDKQIDDKSFAITEATSVATSANSCYGNASLGITPNNDDEYLHYPKKHYILGEDKETKSSWQSLGILPAPIREEESEL